ncbi:MAG: hypothetical protein JEZ05_00620 [Tenericutes bacterium]|nr:hypothetical protein [Mycoplasmatota bacterium]
MLNKLSDYRSDYKEIFKKDKKMYDDALHKKVGNITFMALIPEDLELYNELDLTAYNYENDIEAYTDKLLSLYENVLEKRKNVFDQRIPIISPVLGIGDYSAFVTGDIIFKPDTSWSTPCLENITDYKNFPPIGTSKWYKLFLKISESLMIKMKDKGIPYMRGFFSPLDLAHALRGGKIYYDFYDHPEELHELLDYCADATISFAKDIYALAEKHLGNTEYGCWYTKNKINMSEDIACMISGDLYNEFCAPHTQKVIDYFGVGYMHCHSRAMYLVKEICKLNNVVHLWLATDPNQPRPIEHIKELVESANGASLAIDCEKFSEIEDNIELLKKGNFNIAMPVKNIEEAIYYSNKFNELIKKH